MKRKGGSLSSSLEHGLNLYALAASAAGVGVLALAQPAEAKIIYTKAHQIIGKNSIYLLDLNHDGTSDFTIKNRNCPYGLTNCTSSSWNLLSIVAASSNAVEGTAGQRGNFWGAALKKGMHIPNLGKFSRAATMLFQCKGICATTSKTITYGNWGNVTDRYLGLKLEIQGKTMETHYGWARLSVKVKPFDITATLTGYAYETIRNKPIIAGKTRGKDVIAVQDAGLGRLARGASAIQSWRRAGGN